MAFFLVLFCLSKQYDRTVGKVAYNGNDVCLEQLKLGMAWHYKQFESAQLKEDQETYSQAELSARSQAIGLWKDKNPVRLQMV